jgi:hypothetical protein
VPNSSPILTNFALLMAARSRPMDSCFALMSCSPQGGSARFVLQGGGMLLVFNRLRQVTSAR